MHLVYMQKHAYAVIYWDWKVGRAVYLWMRYLNVVIDVVLVQLKTDWNFFQMYKMAVYNEIFKCGYRCISSAKNSLAFFPDVCKMYRHISHSHYTRMHRILQSYSNHASMVFYIDLYSSCFLEKDVSLWRYARFCKWTRYGPKFQVHNLGFSW